jgi:uncharacterized protein
MSLDSLKEFVLNKISNELPLGLYYHDMEHTQGVYDACLSHIGYHRFSEEEIKELLTAALFHDIGFIWVYDGHEERGVQYAHEILPKWGYSSDSIHRVSQIVLATKFPHAPKDPLQQIMCDADLDYLGTDEYERIAHKLYCELLHFGRVETNQAWISQQIHFLRQHRYYTLFANESREKGKQQQISRLMGLQ